MRSFPRGPGVGLPVLRHSCWKTDLDVGTKPVDTMEQRDDICVSIRRHERRVPDFDYVETIAAGMGRSHISPPLIMTDMCWRVEYDRSHAYFRIIADRGKCTCEDTIVEHSRPRHVQRVMASPKFWHDHAEPLER
jgi:hypothetical protein